MSDLIDRQTAVQPMDSEEKAMRLIKETDAVPVVHGKWIYEGARGRFPACRCSVCGNVENADWAMISGKVNYCPNCGADMRGKEP